MLTLCFGAFFTLLCGNRKDWHKKRHPEVSNRMLYFALLDIADPHMSISKYHTNKASSGKVPPYTDDTVSRAKRCQKGGAHPIQDIGRTASYIKRYKNSWIDVINDFLEFINDYLDEKQFDRLTQGIIRLIVQSDIKDDPPFYVLESQSAPLAKVQFSEKRVYNLPYLLAGALFYILENNIDNGASVAKTMLKNWDKMDAGSSTWPFEDGVDFGSVICAVNIPQSEDIARESTPCNLNVLSCTPTSSPVKNSMFADNLLTNTLSQQHINKNITITDEHGSYIGEGYFDERTEQAIRHGRGTLTRNDGSVYKGEFIRNAMHGKGSITNKDGRVYEATWKDNLIHGSVKTISELGTCYGYNDGELIFVNRIEFSTGYVFEGTLNEDIMEGKLIHPDGRYGRFFSKKGIGLQTLSGDADIRIEITRLPDLRGLMLIFDDGRVYQGEMQNNTPHGYGRLIFPNEMILEMKSDMGETEYGVWTFPNGRMLECVWNGDGWYGSFAEDGVIHQVSLSSDGIFISMKSKGIYKDDDGNIWDGEWLDGLRNGNFTMTTPHNVVIKSAYKNDFPMDHCIMSFPDKSVYEGGFDNGYPNGQGALTLEDGTIYTGTWEDGCYNDNDVHIDLAKMLRHEKSPNA